MKRKHKRQTYARAESVIHEPSHFCACVCLAFVLYRASALRHSWGFPEFREIPQNFSEATGANWLKLCFKMVRKPFLNNFHVFVLLAALVFFVDVSLTEDKLTADNVFSNKSSVPATSITCDAIPTLPSNETFCVCRLSDTQALIDLRGLAWTLSDPQRKGPRYCVICSLPLYGAGSV